MDGTEFSDAKQVLHGSTARAVRAPHWRLACERKGFEVSFLLPSGVHYHIRDNCSQNGNQAIC